MAEAIASALKESRSGPVALPQTSGKVIAAEYMALYSKVRGETAPEEQTKSASEEAQKTAGAR